MTKYEELCGAFQQCNNEDIAYRDRSLSFIARLLTGFAPYIGAPSDQVKFLPPEPRDSKAIYTPMGAAKWEGNGWWVAYVQLTLTQGNGIYPQLAVLFQFRVRVGLDNFTVQLGDSDRTHTISDGANATALETVYDEAYQRAKQYFTPRSQRFVEKANQDSPQKIGFL